MECGDREADAPNMQDKRWFYLSFLLLLLPLIVVIAILRGTVEKYSQTKDSSSQYHHAVSEPNVSVVAGNEDEILKIEADAILSFFIEQDSVSLLNLQGRYVYSYKGGKLFVIQGEALNASEETLNELFVHATIVDEENNGLEEKNVLVGKSFTDREIDVLTLSQIELALSRRVRLGVEDFSIEPGERRPFVVVFGPRPERVVRFQVTSMR